MPYFSPTFNVFNSTVLPRAMVMSQVDEGEVAEMNVSDLSLHHTLPNDCMPLLLRPRLLISTFFSDKRRCYREGCKKLWQILSANWVSFSLPPLPNLEIHIINDI